MEAASQLSAERPGAGAGSPELRLLGPLEAHRAGRPIQLGGARPRALLALLSLSRGKVVPIDRIVDDLWGESPPRTARHMVEVYVSTLRKVLGADVLATRPPGYVLEIDPEHVDIGRFERLLAEGRDALADDDATVAAAKLTDALTLWRGPALADLAYEPFAQAEIARLEEARLLAEEELIEAKLELGKGAELVPDLERLVAAAPLRERFRAQLMRALYRAGRQADALAVYRAARETLVEELGLEPSPELRELERAILAQDDRLVSTRTGVPATRKIATILFVDSAVEAPELDPEALRPALERSLERTEEVLVRHGAAVERAPDGTVMAVFGSPVAHEDDAVRTLHAAAELKELGVASRAAVDTGEVLAGGERTVSGPVVRAAAQLLAAAPPNDVVVGELTRRLAAASAQFEPVEVDGRTVWRVVGVTPGAAPRPLLLDVPVVGRTKELAELRAALSRTVDEQRPGFITVVGEPGVGKSRLAREFAQAAEEEARFLTGRCLAYGEGITYWPLREVLDELAPDATREALDALVAGLADREGVAQRLAAIIGLVEEIYPVEEIRWAARRLFEQLARERPLVLVFEDVHWAEPTFLDLLDHVVEVSKEAPILVVCLARPELLEEHAWGSTILSLEALSDAEAEKLVSRRDSAGRVSGDQRARILDAAEGNPLFLEQLLAFAMEQSPTDELGVPPTLQGLLAARLDRLGPGERSVLACAAVVGREFSGGAVAELVPSEARMTLLRHFEALQRKGLLEPDRSTLPFERAFRFRHVLIQEAAYRSLPKKQRADLHRRLARLLQQTTAASGRDQDEIVGYHLEQAYTCRAELGLIDDSSRMLAVRAGEKLGAAAEGALARNDLPAAVNLLTRATSLYEGAGRLRLDLLVDLGAALFQIGRGSQSLAVLDEAVEAAHAAGERALEWRATIERAHVADEMRPEEGRMLEEHLRLAEQATRELRNLGDDRALARAWRSVSQCRYWLGRNASSLEASRQAIEYARRAGDAQQETWILRIHTMAFTMGPTPTAQAARICRDLLARAPNSTVRACALENLGGLLAMQGEFEEAGRLVDQARRIYEELGLPFRAALTACWYKADVHFLAGDLAAAETELREGIAYFDQTGSNGPRSTATAILAGVLYDAGRYAEAEVQANLAEELIGAAETSDYASLTRVWSVRARLMARRGRIEAAKLEIGRAIALAEATDDLERRGALWMEKAEVLKLAGEMDGAAASLNTAIELLEEKGNLVLAGRARAKLAALHATA